MNQEIKAKWVAALRSGEYTQTKERLRDVSGHCCLGVLCEISKKETGFGIKQNLEDTHGDENLGTTMLMWSGLGFSKGDGAEVSIGGKFGSLSAHNDDGRTFLEIADAIEEQL